VEIEKDQDVTILRRKPGDRAPYGVVAILLGESAIDGARILRLGDILDRLAGAST